MTGLEAMIALDAMTERCQRHSRTLGDEFKIAIMVPQQKKQLRAFWLWIAVQKGMHVEALLNTCQNEDRSDESLEEFAEECAAASRSMHLIRVEIAKTKGGIDHRFPPKNHGGPLDDIEARIRRLSAAWFTKIAPHEEMFDPSTDYVTKWRQLCKDYCQQVPKEGRQGHDRGRNGTTAHTA